MSSAQQSQLARTREDSGNSALAVPPSATGFWMKICGLLLGTLSGRSRDMPKPGNVGAPRPVNTLSHNSTSPRTPFGVPPASRRPPSSPPEAKRRKVDEDSTAAPHSQATFVPIPSSEPRKRSLESISITDTQPSPGSNKGKTQRGVAEYRHLDIMKTKRRRTDKHNEGLLRQEGLENTGRERVFAPKFDQEESEDELNLNNDQKAVALIAGGRKQLEGRPLSAYMSRFDIRPEHKKAADRVERNMGKRQPRGPRAQEPDDELALDIEETDETRPSRKRERNFSSSLSMKGHIKPTNFKSTSGPRPHATTAAKLDAANKQKSDAATIIGDGLRILRGASGQHKYDVKCGDDPNPCLLSVRLTGHTLLPVDSHQSILKPYIYLTLDLRDVQAISRDESGKENCIAIINQSIKSTNSAGPKLMLEFASPPELEKFFQWAALYINNYSFTIKHCDGKRLKAQLDDMMQRNRTHKVTTDDTKNPTADDIRVIQHNRNNRDESDRGFSTSHQTKQRIRDVMTLSKPEPDGDGMTTNQSRDGRQTTVSQQRQQPRATRSTLTCIDSPECEPEPPGWTTLNLGWEEQWRNSLVYPDTGRNRATIDKDDIQRLDEGQFLNDKIIFFYLRYLQKNLEDKNPNLANRIYFHNTFFYDRLKPAKAGQGINYKSVKSWTSKVDLFTKDYIIVPINEHTHWYVAIICNAPMLLSYANNFRQGNDMRHGTVVIPNTTEAVQRTIEVPLQNGVSHGHTNVDGSASPAKDEFIDGVRRMSIDSSDIATSETKQISENAGEGANLTVTNIGDHAFEIKDSDKTDAEVEHVATMTNTQTRKKTGRRKLDPNQPRIITLDSLGVTHSPTCNHLRQYLIAELRDKREIEIFPPGTMGTTAKDVPEQTNHCDCGLFLLGYVEQFLTDPDRFIKCLLQRDTIPWRLDPSQLRNNIRDLIFKLQKEQQRTEDVAQERKRQMKTSKLRSTIEEAPNHTTAPAISPPCTPSMKSASASRSHPDSEVGETHSLLALSSPRPSTPGSSRTVFGETTTPGISPASRKDVKRVVITEVQPSVSEIPGSRLEVIQRPQMQAKPTAAQPTSTPKPSRNTTASHQIIEQPSNAQSHNRVADTALILLDNQARGSHSPSTEKDDDSSTPKHFLHPLPSETPSLNGSPGATKLDPVVLDDSSKNGQDAALPRLPKRSIIPSGNQLIVEISSANVGGGSPGHSGKTGFRKQTGEQSSFFATKQDGDRVTSAKLRDKPESSVIDLLDD